MGRRKKYFCNPWHWLDWFSAIGGGVIILLWILFLVALNQIQDQAMNVVELRPNQVDTASNRFTFSTETRRLDYLDKIAVLHQNVATMAVFLMWYRLFICWYVIIVMVRFFQAFLAQPKLAIVTNTIIKSMPDVFHFLIVLLLVMLAYATAAVFLFGHRILGFSELHFAFNKCLLIMLGDFDFSELSNEHLVTASIWFVTYMILVALIMLNMLLAIIMDLYTEVKADADDQEPLWTQLANTMADLVHKKNWVKFSKVEEVMNKWYDCPEKVDYKMLMNKISDMPKDQAVDIITEADRQLAAEETKGLSISDAMKMVGWIKIAVQKIAHRIEDILLLEKEERALLAQGGLGSKKVSSAAAGQQKKVIKLDPAADRKLQDIDKRIARMEDFLNESMCATVSRTTEVRSRLKTIETMLKAIGDAQDVEHTTF
jgi:hypothetical protein